MHEFRPLAEDVYVYVQPALVWYSTAGVVVGERRVLVVDSLASEAMARSLLEEIRKITDKPVGILVNTHSHADHVYTNHLFGGATVICSRRGREKTLEFQRAQAQHDELFARLFPDVDLSGGRYTPQGVTFDGGLSIHQGGREIRVLELGPGHSESDVIVHLPAAGVVFCGDAFMNGLPPMPGEGHLTDSIRNMRKLEDLGAGTYAAGHGPPGTRKELAEQRALLESLAAEARRCFDDGLGYEEAVEAVGGASFPVEFARPVVLSGYCEWAGKMPECADPSRVNHMDVMSGFAREASLLLRQRQGRA